MSSLSSKTKTMREAGRRAAEALAASGDRSLLDAASRFAAGVKGVREGGALEILVAVGLCTLRYDGKAREVSQVEKGLAEMDRQERGHE
jgi:hypothetical protein